jgi:hypothetical protein
MAIVVGTGTLYPTHDDETVMGGAPWIELGRVFLNGEGEG